MTRKLSFPPFYEEGSGGRIYRVGTPLLTHAAIEAEAQKFVREYPARKGDELIGLGVFITQLRKYRDPIPAAPKWRYTGSDPQRLSENETWPPDVMDEDEWRVEAIAIVVVVLALIGCWQICAWAWEWSPVAWRLLMGG